MIASRLKKFPIHPLIFVILNRNWENKTNNDHAQTNLLKKTMTPENTLPKLMPADPIQFHKLKSPHGEWQVNQLKNNCQPIIRRNQGRHRLLSHMVI